MICLNELDLEIKSRNWPKRYINHVFCTILFNIIVNSFNFLNYKKCIQREVQWNKNIIISCEFLEILILIVFYFSIDRYIFCEFSTVYVEDIPDKFSHQVEKSCNRVTFIMLICYNLHGTFDLNITMKSRDLRNYLIFKINLKIFKLTRIYVVFFYWMD